MFKRFFFLKKQHRIILLLENEKHNQITLSLWSRSVVEVVVRLFQAKDCMYLYVIVCDCM